MVGSSDGLDLDFHGYFNVPILIASTGALGKRKSSIIGVPVLTVPVLTVPVLTVPL